MKNFIILISSIFIIQTTFAQNLLTHGKISSIQPVRIIASATNSYGESAVVGTFYDSVNVNLNGGTTMLYGGSSANNIHNSFLVTYDLWGNVINALHLGTATDSVTINAVAFNSNDVAITGKFSSNIDFSGGISSPTFLTATGGDDAFVATYNFNLFINYASLLETTGSIATGTAIEFGFFGDIYVAGYFNGTIDLDPSASNADFVNNGTYNGFLVTLNFGSYVNGGKLEGTGIIKPHSMAFDDNIGQLILTGKFNNSVDFDLIGSSANIPSSNGLFDAFFVNYTPALIPNWFFKLGGTGNDYGKDVNYTYSGNPILLMDFSNSINMNPNGTPINLTSNGLTDVAIAEYDLSGNNIFAKGFGNANANESYKVEKVFNFGGRGGPPPPTINDLTFTMNFSGSMDFDPDPVNVSMDNSQNTPVNAAVVDIDSLGNYISHGKIEGYSINGLFVNDYNEVVLIGNFEGSSVDLLPYDSTAYLSHTPNAGYYIFYNRCRIANTTPELFEPYECGTCSATLFIPNIINYRSPLNINWDLVSENYSFNGLMALNACPSNNINNYYNINIYDGWGCYASDTFVFYETPASQFDVLLNVTNTSCGNNFGSADATPVNAIGNISYLWSTGNTSFDQDSLNAGTYTVSVLDDGRNCYLEKPVLIDNSDGPTITLVSTTNANCSNIDNGMIDISVSGGAAPYTFLWNTGATTEDISGLSGGNYSVTVTDITGCENSYCVDILQGNDISVYWDNMWWSSCLTSDGALMVTASGGSGPLSLLWGANAGSSTNDTVFNLFAGQYSLQVTDSLGCTEDFLFGVSDWNGPYLYINYIDQPTCIGIPGLIDVYSWDPVDTYSWSNGETTEDLTNISAGEYVLTATDFSGCITTQYAFVQDMLPASPTICMVTTDSTATQNVVVFDKSNSPEADYYKIYREGYCNVNNFGVVGYVDEDSLSVFYDTVVNSDTRSWRYYVTAVDTCGNESDPSVIHRTIHLTANWDTDTNIVLDWSAYVGMDIVRYKIYRRQASGNLFDLVDSVDVTQTNYLDTISFFGYAELEYFIDAVPLYSCNATRAYNQNEARSNHAKRNVPEAITLTTPEFGTTNIQMYPNPTNDLVQLVVDDNHNWNVQILNHIGQIVVNGQVNGRAAFTTKELPVGIYFVKVDNQNTKETKVLKLVVAR